MARPSRKERAAFAEETVHVIQQGQYYAAERTVDIGAAVKACTSATTCYPQPPPEWQTVRTRAAPGQEQGQQLQIHVVNQSTLQAARALAASGSKSPVALNFASAKNPGGGFLNGALAQEESLALCSALYACLTSPQCEAYYASNRALTRGSGGGRGGRAGPAAPSAAIKPYLYTDAIIYSPDVPVIRDDATLQLLPEPYLVSFITSPAPNKTASKQHGHGRGHADPDDEIQATLRRRARHVLRLAAEMGHRDLVLGAWGCGVFGNDPRFVAQVFKELLVGPEVGAGSGCFDRVVFAVLGDENLRAFEQVFR